MWTWTDFRVLFFFGIRFEIGPDSSLAVTLSRSSPRSYLASARRFF